MRKHGLIRELYSNLVHEAVGVLLIETQLGSSLHGEGNGVEG